MKKKARVLYIATLQLKHKKQLDGETIKSQNIFDVLCRNFSVTAINLANHKVWQTIKLLFLSLFRKYDYYVVSKSRSGAEIILKILKQHKVPREKIIYCVIGSGLPKLLENKKIDVNVINHTKKIIVETDFLKQSLEKFNLPQVDVFPNFKKTYDIKIPEKNYPKEVLKLVFLARLVSEKGIFDLVEVIDEINKDKVKFSLDVYGAGNHGDMSKMKAIANNRSYVTYFGPIIIENKKDYEMLAYYDLHVFPTLHEFEGVPGSLIDFFIAGVPTLSSRYPNYANSLDERCAFLYPFKDKSALKNALIYVYEHQEELIVKGENGHMRCKKYDINTFEKYFVTLLGSDLK